jgi:hypothetical protein
MYYAVDNGVWFVSASPDGPWTVATNVPDVIYSIPVSSPIHYVTYVRIYGYSPEYAPGAGAFGSAPSGAARAAPPSFAPPAGGFRGGTTGAVRGGGPGGGRR